MAEQVRNWAGNVTFGSRDFHRPTSVDQLRTVVSGADTVKVLGSGHSFSRIADTTGDLVSIAGLPATVDLDTAGHRVRVAAGVRFGELAGELEAAGLALHNMGSLPHISVGGAVATGTHGSGHLNRCLAGAVAGLRMVTADGDLVELQRGEEDFDGCVVALGALGVVVELVLDVRPSYQVRQDVYEGLPFDTLAEHFDEIVDSAYSVSLFTDWRANQVDQAWRKRLVADAGTGPAAPTWFGARLADGPRNPVPGFSPDSCTTQGGEPGPWSERLPHFRPDFTPSSGDELQTEYLVPREHGVAALAALAPLAPRIAEQLQIGEIRTIAADELWLSPAYHRDSVGLHFTWDPDQERVETLLRDVESALAPFAPRPHWGKVFVTAPADVAAQYERLGDFQGLRRRFDPAGKLRNEMLDRYLPG